MHSTPPRATPPRVTPPRAAPPPGDLARLRSVLNALPTASLPPRVLSVGCGSYPCAATLHGARPGWTLWGIDRDRVALREARRRDPLLRLVQADARALPGLLRPLVGGFGLVLVRHPDLFRSAGWAVILPGLRALVTPGGALVITLYAPDEADMVRRWGLVGSDPAGDEAAFAPVDMAGHDRYVIVVRVEEPRDSP